MNRLIFSLICILLLYGNVASVALGSPEIGGVNVFLFSIVFILILNVFKYSISPILIVALFLLGLVLFLKYFVDNFEFSTTIVKLTYSLLIYVLFYLYIRTIDFKDVYYLNYLFIIFIVTSLITFVYAHFFPSLSIATDEFNEPIGFVFLNDDNGYTRDGLFGANILSYILVLGLVFVVSADRTWSWSFFLRLTYFISSWLAIITLQSRFATVTYLILSFYFIFKFSRFWALAISSLFLFSAQRFQILNRFSESSGRSEKYVLYVREIFKIRNFFFGQSEAEVVAFNKKSVVSLSDNSFFEVLLGGGIFYFVVFFTVLSYIIKGSIREFNINQLVLVSFFFVGLMITTSIYFINYVFFFILMIVIFSRKEIQHIDNV